MNRQVTRNTACDIACASYFLLLQKIMSTFAPPSPASPIEILLVEDYDLVRRGIELLLGSYSELKIVGTANNGTHALELVTQTRPDVVLLDLMLGQENGLDVLPHLLKSGAKHVIIFTGTADETIHQDAMALGASAVVEKCASGENLADCIRRVYQGKMLHACA